MTATPLARRLLPRRQRIRDLQDELLSIQGQLRLAAGIQVIVCCSCGHADCGDPPPVALPRDAWVVNQGCRRLVPEQVTPEAIAAVSAPSKVSELPPQMQQDYQELLALATGQPEPPKPTIRWIPR